MTVSKIRSMTVVQTESDNYMVYVLTEGHAHDCVVRMMPMDLDMLSAFPADGLMVCVAELGHKVPISAIDTLPFKIPSHLTYRA